MGNVIYTKPKISREWLPYPTSEYDFKALENAGVIFGRVDATGQMVQVQLDRSLTGTVNDDIMDGAMYGSLYKNGHRIAGMQWHDAFGRPHWTKINVTC